MNLKKEAVKIAAVIIIICVAGTVFAYSGSFDRASRFYGTWQLIDFVEEPTVFGTLDDGFYFIFHTNKSLEIKVSISGQEESIFRIYDVISDTDIMVNIGTSDEVTLTYVFSTSSILYLGLPDGGYYKLIKVTTAMPTDFAIASFESYIIVDAIVAIFIVIIGLGYYLFNKKEI